MNYFKITRVLIVLIFLVGMPLALTHAGNIPYGSACPSGNNGDCSDNYLCVNHICQNASDIMTGKFGYPTNNGTLQGTNSGGSLQGTNSGAQTSGSSGLTNPLNASDLATLLKEILTYVVQIGGIFLTVMLVFVGFQFVAARGNDEKLRSARTALVWTVIGGIILLGANALASDIVSTVQGL